MSDTPEVNAPAAAAPVADQPQPEFEPFSPAQQLKLDSILKAAMGRAGKDARIEAAAERRKREDLERVLNEQYKNPDNSKLELEMELTRAKQAEADLRAEVEASRKNSAIQKSFKSANVELVDAELGARLLGEAISYNSETKTYISTDETGNPISLEEAAKKFADAYKNEATLIQQNLLKFQISAFVAHADIEPTKKWQDEIELALTTADALVALLTPRFHESKWTDQEIGFALGRGLPILTIRLGEDPYGFLAREQATQGTGVAENKLAAAIFNVFVKHKHTQKRMAESVVSRFELSNQFADTKNNFALVDRVQYWNDQLADRLKAAVKQNDQISGAWGIPEKVKAFLKERSST